jgi:hypothetical protein
MQILRVLAWLLAAVPVVAAAHCHPNCPPPSPGGLAFGTQGAYLSGNSFRSTDKFVLGAGLGYAFPHEPLKAEQFYVKLIPGVWTSSSESDGYLAAADFRGWLFGGSLVYAFNPNWGVSFTGVWEQSTDGSAETVTVYQRKRGSPVSLPGEAEGYIAALAAIWDPVAGPQFRLPIAFGIGYNYYSATIEGNFDFSSPGGTRTFRYYGNHKVSRMSLFLGVAPQFDYRNFRFIPFIVTSDSAFFNGEGKSTVRFQNAGTGAVREAQLAYNEVTYLSGGLTVKYVPWDLGLSYIRGDLTDRGIDTSVFSLSWEKKW